MADNPTQTTIKKREKFLDAYREIGIIRDAAKIANIHRSTVYEWIKDNETFKVQFEEAKEEAVEKLEREAIRRAAEGIDKPIYYKGELVDTVKEYSDTLMIFLLKGMNPDKYADRSKQEHSGPNGGPIQTEDVTHLTPEERRNRINELIRERGTGTP